MTTIYASFGDSIYIILGLGWVIYSIYSAKKKKKAKANSSSNNDNKPFLESIISEMGFSNENHEPSDDSLHETNYADNIVEEEDYAKQEEVLFSYDDMYEKNDYIPPYEVVDNEQVVITNKVTSNKNITNLPLVLKKKNSKKRINLRKAIVYSVILKKVYF